LALHWTLSGVMKLKFIFLYMTLLCTRRLVSYQYHCENLRSCNCIIVYISLCYMCFTRRSHRKFTFSEEHLTDHKNLNITHNTDIIEMYNFRMKHFLVWWTFNEDMWRYFWTFAMFLVNMNKFCSSGFLRVINTKANEICKDQAELGSERHVLFNSAVTC